KAPPQADAAKTDLPASADADVVTLTVTFADAIPMLPAGVDATLLTRDSADYYQAMVNGFAAGVAHRLN
ncbi:MAG: hypothetical protein U1D06_09365, partial [Paracoccaceae bacterium]|nr:hypothetical protein [Paracoccaceae bacterium]